LEGVWDLLMLGAEALDVEHAYQHLTGGVPVELVCLGGPLVASPDKSHCFQLLDSYKRDVRPNKNAITGRPALSKEGREAINRMNQILGPSSDEVSPEHEFDWDYETVWYPAAGLPKGHALVVRSAALRELERKLLSLMLNQRNQCTQQSGEACRRSSRLLPQHQTSICQRHMPLTKPLERWPPHTVLNYQVARKLL